MLQLRSDCNLMPQRCGKSVPICYKLDCLQITNSHILATFCHSVRHSNIQHPICSQRFSKITSTKQHTKAMLHCHSPKTFRNVIERCIQTLRKACYQEIPESAICVQSLDDSRDLAICITYRISLRSSSLWEPRHPLLKVVNDCVQGQPQPSGHAH